MIERVWSNMNMKLMGSLVATVLISRVHAFKYHSEQPARGFFKLCSDLNYVECRPYAKTSIGSKIILIRKIEISQFIGV